MINVLTKKVDRIYYTLICSEFAATGGIIIHKEVNVASIYEAYEYIDKYIHQFPTASWLLKPSIIIA